MRWNMRAKSEPGAVHKPERKSLFNIIETPIPFAAKMALLAYVIVYRVLTPPVAALLSGENLDFSFPRIVVTGALELLLAAPILFGKKIGLLHPLAFPLVFAIAFNVIFSPMHLVFPFVLSAKLFIATPQSWSVLLRSLSAEDYAQYHTMLAFAGVLFWGAVFLGFRIGDAFRTVEAPDIADRKKVSRLAVVWVALAIGFAVLFILSRGGVAAQISSFRLGRYVTYQGLGFAGVILKSAGICLLLWAAYDAKAFRRPVFLAFAALLVPLYFLIDGSRTGVLLLLLSLGMLACFRLGRIPVTAAAGMAAFAVAAVGALGMVRQDYHATSFDAAVLSPERIGEWIDASREETLKREAEEGDLAAFVAANERGLLWGRTYLSVLAFPVPRAIWAEKPKNVFTYTAWIAFLGNDADTLAPSIWGIPTGPVAESFWNFSWAGPPVVGFGVGIFFGWLTALFRRNPDVGWIAVLYLLSLLYFSGGSRAALYWVQYVAELIFFLALIKWLPEVSTYRRESRAPYRDLRLNSRLTAQRDVRERGVGRRR